MKEIYIEKNKVHESVGSENIVAGVREKNIRMNSLSKGL